MSNYRKTLVVLPVLIFILACQTLTRPIQQAQDTAATAAAFATQASGLASEVAPFETFIPNPSEAPGVPGNIFDPQSAPLSEWNGIPVMPQAIAGEESEEMYAFKVAATAQDVEAFYAAQLPPLGWEKSVSMPLGDTAILVYLVYTKGNETLSITVMPMETGELIVLLTLG